jgi:hypothetical protein
METIYYGNNKVSTGKYDSSNGEIVIYLDPTRIDPNAKARREEYEAKRQKDKANFERLLQVTEQDSDNGRN